MFQVSLCMLVSPLAVTQAVKALRSITMTAQVERGFVASQIYQEVDRPEAITLEQNWSSEQELKSHIRSSCFTDLLMLMETAVEQPRFEVRLMTMVAGLEYVDAVRFGK